MPSQSTPEMPNVQRLETRACDAPRHRSRSTAGALFLAVALCAAFQAPVEAQKKAAPKKAAPKRSTTVRKPAAKPKPSPKSSAKAKRDDKPTAAAATPVPPKAKPKKDDSVAFFRDGVVPRLKILIPDTELQRLRQQPREYVRCTVIENDKTEYEHVGIHLKGAAGSFRGVDDRPALTLNFDKFAKDQEFHDLDKIHLNNSVQDPGYLNELISSELFLSAGIPAARTTHARVWLNGRDLGFYVLKEGFNKGFLKRHFEDPDGNLYEGAFVQDIDGKAKLQNGTGPIDRSDIKAVIEACREGDPAKRWQRLEQVVDIDKLLTFIAMEFMTCHWDGYCQNRNNYRFYFEPKTGKMQFFPHGMDQMFADPNFSVLNMPGGMVARTVLGNPEWRADYRDRLAELMKLFVPENRLLERVDAHHQRLRPVLAEMGEPHAVQFDQRVKDLKNRLIARGKSLMQQNAVVESLPLRFNPKGFAVLTHWAPQVETADAKVEMVEGSAGKPNSGSLTITAGPSGRCVASWRMKVLLTAGKYRLEGRARTQGVKALMEGPGTGVGLRLSGSQRTNKLDGTANWTPLAHDFQIQNPIQEVVLVAEMRAAAGQAFFEASSLRLVRLPN